jgi:hypothetical protein
MITLDKTLGEKKKVKNASRKCSNFYFFVPVKWQITKLITKLTDYIALFFFNKNKY